MKKQDFMAGHEQGDALRLQVRLGSVVLAIQKS